MTEKEAIREQGEERERTDPVVNPQPRHTPKHDDIPASEDLPSNNQPGNHNRDTHITQENQAKLALLIEDRILAKMKMADLGPTCTTI